MPKVELKAGASLDVLNADELEDRMAPMFKGLTDALADKGTPMWVPCPKIAVPTNGILSTDQLLYAVPTGFEAHIHRIAISADGYTPGAPLNTAGAWLQLWRNTAGPYNLLYGLPSGGAAVLPAVITEGSRQASLLRHGERLVMTCSLGTVASNTALYVALYVWLEAIDGR